MQDASTISAADPLTVQRENAHLRCLNAELLDTINKQKSQIEQLEARLDWLIRQHFGRRSERVNPDQGSLFAEPEGESEPAPPPPPPDEEVVSKRKGKGHGRQKAAKELPRETQVIDVPESEKRCPCCGHEKICIGQDKTERHDYQPPKIFIRETVRPTYMCRECEQQGRPIQASQAPLPPEPIPRGICAPGLLAHLVVSKYWDHLPLYRQENMLGRLGWKVSRSTLCDQVMASADVLLPLYELMCQRVRQSEALHTDDTPVTLLDPLRKAYAWVYVGGEAQPFTVFDMSAGRQQEHPETFLKGYRGFIHADAYIGYKPLYDAGATHIGCWAHTRRYFFEAKENDPARAHEAIARIRQLYSIEAEIKEQKLTDEALVACRRERAGPILDEFATWLTEEVPKLLPKSKIGEAFNYASNQWPTLIRYIHDARLHIDNNPAEQAIRGVALGRKNWLHIGGDGGLRRAAVLLSLAASAKRHRVAPWEYVKDLLTQLPARAANADLSDLLPNLWPQIHRSA
jgi:transposase